MSTKCLHLRTSTTYSSDPNFPGYDKMGQVREVKDKVTDNFKAAWNLEIFLTIYEMMI